jgi:hypothetical protein
MKPKSHPQVSMARETMSGYFRSDAWSPSFSSEKRRRMSQYRVPAASTGPFSKR